MAFRNQVEEFALELCKEESKLDYDRMADLIKEYEGYESKVIKWCFRRIRKIAPTIHEAEKKMNGINEAT